VTFRARRVLLAALLAGCGEPVLLGGTAPDGGTTTTITVTTEDAGQLPDPQCHGRGCGVPCQIDPCAGAGACTIAPTPGSCDANGACRPDPVHCPPDPDCAGQPCGTPCDPCQGQPPGCHPPGPTACDASGACVPASIILCPFPWAPCAGAPCGTPCSLCRPDDPGCIEPPGPKSCDDHGTCVMGQFGCGGPTDGGPGP
jgi:hypothetical protein